MIFWLVLSTSRLQSGRSGLRKWAHYAIIGGTPIPAAIASPGAGTPCCCTATPASTRPARFFSLDFAEYLWRHSRTWTGAWSLPLVAHAKSLGACAIHLGGATQILLGVKGKAWEGNGQITAFYNEAWTRPSSSETPQGISNIENGCYW